MMILFSLLVALGADAQKTDAMLFGDVKSKVTGEHIPGATVKVKGTTIATACDASGHFKLSDLPTGRQTIVASALGYREKTVVVDMRQAGGTEVYFELDDDNLGIEQVVITGTRTEHFVKDVPIRTEVLTSKAIERKNAQNLFEALAGVPGIRAEEQCQFCNFSMVRMQGLGAEHTQVLIDGEPIYSGLASVYGLQQIGTNDIDRLEIVKGAGSALYGSSAVAGAINIITKEPTFEPSVKADVQFGSYGYKNYDASASLRFGKVGLNVFAQRTESDPIDYTQDGLTRDVVKHKDGISDRVAAQSTNLGFGVYVFSPFAKNDKLTLRAKAIDETRMGGTLTDNLYLNPYSAGTENIRTNRLQTDLKYDLPIGQRALLSFSTAYVYHKRNATNDTFLTSYMDSHGGASPDVQSMRPYLATENTVTPSLTFQYKLRDHTLLGGVQGSITRLEESGLYCVDDTESTYYGTAYTSLGKKHATEMGIFVQDEWNILQNLTAVPGVRIDFHHSGEEYSSSQTVFDSAFPKTKFNETSVNPRLALKYAVSPKLVLRANFGTGFRAPYGFSEDLHLCSGSPRVWKSSNLKGERAISFNLSADYYGSWFQASINLFHTNLRDKIEFATADASVKKLGYTYQWENVDDAFVQGIELSGKVNPVRNLTATVSYTLNRGRYKHVRGDWEGTPWAEDSKKVSRFPSMTGDFDIAYTPGSWSFSLTGSLQGKMYIDYMAEKAEEAKIKKTSPFMTFNCRAAKTFAKIVTVYAGAKNLLGYVQDEKHTDDAAFMYAPVYGATWYAGVSVNL